MTTFSGFPKSESRFLRCQIVNGCRSRLRFFAEKLNYTPDRDSSMAHLKSTYHKYLADLFAARVDAAEPVKTADDQTH
jgi:hypothetical protein